MICETCSGTGLRSDDVLCAVCGGSGGKAQPEDRDVIETAAPVVGYHAPDSETVSKANSAWAASTGTS